MRAHALLKTLHPMRAAVRLGSNHPLSTVAAALVLCAAALWFVVGHFDMTSDTAKLISDKVDWRRREAVMDAAFPQNNDTTVVVIDGATPELAEAATASSSSAFGGRTGGRSSPAKDSCSCRRRRWSTPPTNWSPRSRSSGPWPPTPACAAC
jgi:predicted exporter